MFANERPGVVVLANADPSVRGNRFRDGRENGVWVYEHGAYGTRLGQGATSTRASPQPTPRLSTTGRGRLFGNEFFRNAEAEIAVAAAAGAPPRHRTTHRPRSHASHSPVLTPLLPPQLQRRA